MRVTTRTTVYISDWVHFEEETGPTVWAKVRARHTEFSYLTPLEAYKLGLMLVDRYGPRQPAEQEPDRTFAFVAE